MKKTIFALILLVSLSATAKVYKIETYPIPLMVEDKDHGVFITLTREIAKTAGVEIEIAVLPPKRTVNNFVTQASDGFFPALDVIIPSKFARSSNIYIKRDFAFTKKGIVVNDVKDLEGKAVGITAGYPYSKAVTGAAGVVFTEGSSDQINMQKLEAGRIFAFVVEEKTGIKAMEDSAVKEITYNSAKPLSEQDVYYAFQDDADGKVLAQKFSETIEKMKGDGSFRKIMEQAQKQKLN